MDRIESIKIMHYSVNPHEFFWEEEIFYNNVISQLLTFIPRSGYSFVERHYKFKRFPVGDKHFPDQNQVLYISPDLF